ncbi:hypothetical protein [Parasediminibacterium sp. JCM 36343]|uniref:hypothetical protein n=1 Tax=Parasediminibacterium sp. JCM 36343 TaxID=3374279 RepID=UPI003978F357
MIDELFVLIKSYGLFIALSLGILKLLILFWYKPQRPSYAFRNFLNYYGKYAMRDERQERWLKFKKMHNPTTILFYVITISWLITMVIYIIVSK